MKKMKVLSIKNEQILKQVENALSNKFQYVICNYAIFQVGKMTLLRISDVLNLYYTNAFDEYEKYKII